MNKLAVSQESNSERVAQEISEVRQELRDMRVVLNSLQERRSAQRPRRVSLLRPRLSRRAPVEPEKPKPSLSLEDLLPLLPHLSSALPQVKSSKVAESLKILSNPAVLSMIQQFIANGGLQGLKQKQEPAASRRDRRLFSLR
ncbi:hypothetical protein ACAF76_019075 [Brevibacillus sp. TJ4]|uniref:hypothetical protein n=1 Tax=Brevibacillus sp. TJ4 TaxID=3234853 RepID=UPI003BA1F22E